MHRIPRPAWQSLHAATAAAVLLTCAAGCSSHPEATASAHRDASIPATAAEARALMRRFDGELAALRMDPATGAAVRERLRGRLLAANLPTAEVDAWTTSQTTF